MQCLVSSQSLVCSSTCEFYLVPGVQSLVLLHLRRWTSAVSAYWLPELFWPIFIFLHVISCSFPIGAFLTAGYLSKEIVNYGCIENPYFQKFRQPSSPFGHSKVAGVLCRWFVFGVGLVVWLLSPVASRNLMCCNLCNLSIIEVICFSLYGSAMTRFPGLKFPTKPLSKKRVWQRGMLMFWGIVVLI